MRALFSLAVTASMGLLLTGCATIISGNSQVIRVQAIDVDTHNPVDQARCTITDAKNVSYSVFGNPGQTVLPRVYGGLTVNCVAPHYWQKSVGAGSSFNAWTLCDIVFWPSAFVDVATGAAQNYPSFITVLMSSKPVKAGPNKIK